MELQGSRGNNGVKVTYIETQFVTSDAASFKSIVQRLTGKKAAEPAVQLHRPRPCRTRDHANYCVSSDAMETEERRRPAKRAVTEQMGAAAAAERAALWLEEVHEISDFADLSYVSTGERGGGGGGEFPY